MRSKLNLGIFYATTAETLSFYAFAFLKFSLNYKHFLILSSSSFNYESLNVDQHKLLKHLCFE
jgi:hypothetical protein